MKVVLVEKMYADGSTTYYGMLEWTWKDGDNTHALDWGKDRVSVMEFTKAFADQIGLEVETRTEEVPPVVLDEDGFPK